MVKCVSNNEVMGGKGIDMTRVYRRSASYKQMLVILNSSSPVCVLQLFVNVGGFKFQTCANFRGSLKCDFFCFPLPLHFGL